MIPWITLYYYHDEALTFDVFDPSSYSVDSTKRISTKNKDQNWRGCYGGIPIRCDGNNREIHELELKVKGIRNYMLIGISEGRMNTEWSVYHSDSNHYLLWHSGYFLTKGNNNARDTTNAADMIILS